MINTPRRPPELVMTPDGQFHDVRPPAPPLLARIAAGSILLAVLAGVMGLAALAFWFAVSLLPVVLVAGAVGWIALRIQAGRVRGGGWPAQR